MTEGGKNWRFLHDVICERPLIVRILLNNYFCRKNAELERKERKVAAEKKKQEEERKRAEEEAAKKVKFFRIPSCRSIELCKDKK